MTALLTDYRRLIACLLPALVASAGALAAQAPAAPNLLLSEDGAYVLNMRAKLAWPRCVEGMQWTGKTCKGKPLLLTHTEAIALAADRKSAEGVHWRLPRVTELQQLVNHADGSPGLDPKLFPAAPDDWYWSASANVNTRSVNQYNYGNAMQGRTSQNANHMAFLHGWAVNLETGEARGDVAKRTKLPVRLVRPLE